MIMMIIIIIIIVTDEAEKIPKYKDLTTEIQFMRNVKTKLTPVRTGANGTIINLFRKYLSNIPIMFILEQATKAQRRSGGTVLLLL